MVGKQRSNITITYIAVALFIISLSVGCDEQTAGRPKHDQMTPSAKSEKPMPDSPVNKDSVNDSETVETETPADANSTKVILYFSDAQGESLVSEKRQVSIAGGQPQAVVKELIAGPSEAGSHATIPSGTRLITIEITDNVAKVDFSAEFIDNHSGGSSGEQMTVYSVVNSLTESSTIGSVRFLVEGNPIDTIAGHMDLSQPIKRRE